MRRDDALLHVVDATDSVRDRFMHYWAWNDYSGLAQALAVAKAQRNAVDLGAIRAWTDIEIAETPVYDRGRRDNFLTELERVLC